MDKLQKELRGFAKDLGIDVFGVADITSAHSFVTAQGGEQIGRFPRTLSMGVKLTNTVVDELIRHEDPVAVYTYRGLYNSANMKLDNAGLSIANRLQDAGYKAYPIPAAQTVNARKLEAAISHKLAANLAGLGWIGKNCLLITPDFGPRLRLATILTDAPMEPGKQLLNRCGECKKCVDICPPKALTGVPFNPSEPRDIRFRAYLCSDYSERRTKILGEGVCGLCLYACPFGSKVPS